MAVVFKQAVSKSDTQTTFTKSITPQVNPSVLIIGFAAQNSAAITVTSVSDPTNGSWTLIVDESVAGTKYSETWCYYVKNTTTSAITVSVVCSGAVAASLSILEFSGADTTTPIGNNSSASLIAGSSADINTSGSISASTGDAIVVFGGNYYAPTWVVGGTNPSGIAIPSGATANQGTGFGNITAAYAILAGSYNAVVGINPGTTDYGNVIGIQIVAAGGGGGGGLAIAVLMENYRRRRI